jgi:hypothetical protein
MMEASSENKYRFNMQVSARAMAAAISLCCNRTPRGTIDFQVIRPVNRIGLRKCLTETDGRARLPLP